MAAMTWRCPRCGRASAQEGMCPQCLQLYIADVPEAAEADRAAGNGGPGGAQPAQLDAVPRPASTPVPPTERLALRMPWRQQINLPDTGELRLGRSAPEFRENPDARSADQVSRWHARLYRDEHGDLYVQDLESANGTYVDGAQVEGDVPARLRSGQVLRLAMDVECAILRLNEHGEPEGD